MLQSTATPAVANNPPDSPTLVFGDGSNPAIRLRRRWRRIRWTVFVLACLALVVAALATTQPHTTATPFAPDSTAPQGARALARVLTSRGVAVHQAASVAAALTASSEDTTLVVAPSWALSQDDMALLAATPADLVLLSPMPQLVRLATDGQVEIAIIGADAEPLTAQCPDLAATNASQIWAAANLAVPGWPLPQPPVPANAPASGANQPGGGGLMACFPAEVRDQPLFAFVRQTTFDRTVTIISDPGIITNETIVVEGNAALALWVLGANPEVVWLVIDPLATGQATTEPTALSQLPPWVLPALLALGLTLLVMALVQGRRLGPLVVENLPVAVPALETTRGLGRLYRAGRAREHAATALRAGATTRIEQRLGLPGSATALTRNTAIAQATGREPTAIDRILNSPAPNTDAELVAQARVLDELEQEVSVL